MFLYISLALEQNLFLNSILNSNSTPSVESQDIKFLTFTCLGFDCLVAWVPWCGFIHIFLNWTLSGVRRLAGEKSVYGTGSPVWCSVMTWRDGMGRGGSLGKEGMYVELWLIQVVWQRPRQPCKKRFAIKMITKKKWECCLWGDGNEWGDRNRKKYRTASFQKLF